MKIMTFCNFYFEFIEGNTIYGKNKAINIIFYGKVAKNNPSLSDSTTTKMTDSKKIYIFSSNRQTFKDYINGNLSYQEKIQYFEKLHLNNLPENGKALVNKLNDYNLPHELIIQLMQTNNIHQALVFLLEYIMCNRTPNPDTVKIDSFSNHKDPETFLLHDLVKAMEEKRPVDDLKLPIGWFIQSLLSHTQYNSFEISDCIGIPFPTLRKKTNITTKYQHHLYMNDVQKICSGIGVSLAAILYCYEHKDTIENNHDFIKYMNLLNINYYHNSSNKQERMSTSKSQIKIPEEYYSLKSWYGNYYCYFSSTDHAESFWGKKDTDELPSNTNSIIPDELFTPDNIYIGLLELKERKEFSSNCCEATFTYRLGKKMKPEKKFYGTCHIAKNKVELFVELFNEIDDEILYLIFKDTKTDNAGLIMASALTVSNGKHPHYPVSLRMILSKNSITADSSLYPVIRSNLKMYDGLIRIDSYGFSEVQKELLESNDPVRIDIAKKYQSLQELGDTKNITYQKIAYIADSYIESLVDLSEEQQVIFETLLRLHSIDSWYEKSNATRVNKLSSFYYD